jgi:hypothetical protein
VSATRGLVAGVLALSITEAILSSEQTTLRDPVGSVVGLFTRGFRRLVDPTVPLIPDTRSTSSKGGGSAGSSAPPASYVHTPSPAPAARPAATGQTIVNA